MTSKGVRLLRLPVSKYDRSKAKVALSRSACTMLRFPRRSPRPSCQELQQFLQQVDRGLVSAAAPGAAIASGRSRGFSSSRVQPPGLTTKLSVSGGMLTINLPLPGLPGLTDVSVPVDAPVRRLVQELKGLDNR